MFMDAYETLNTVVKKDGWYLEVNMKNGQLVKDWVDALQAFWPAVQVLIGDVDQAVDMHHRHYAIWKAWGKKVP